MPVTLDSLSKIVTIVSAGIAVFAAWIALPLDAELKRLQTQTQKLDIDLKATEGRLKEAEARLKETESGRKLSFDLYKEVRNILERKDKTPKDEEALRVLIESLADDPFRYKLLGVLAVSASTPEVKRAATESSSFFREEAQVVAQKAPVSPAPDGPGPTVRSTAVGSMDVDVFYCAARQATSEPIARSILALRQSGESGRWRLRFLPDSVNQQPGYGITSNEIRYNVPDETEAAKLLAERIGKTGLKVALRESQQPTRWYISLFICQ